MNSGSISFCSTFEAFIDCDTELLAPSREIACDDKHVVFYVDEKHPRHFRPWFEGATAALRIRRDLCYALLLSRQFVPRGDPATVALAMLHIDIAPPERQRVYLDRDSVEHLFSSRTKHRVVNESGALLKIRYDDDQHIGAACYVRLSRRQRLTVADKYLAQRLGAVAKEFVAVNEGRGWLWIIPL